MPDERNASFRLVISHRDDVRRGEQPDASTFWRPFLRVTEDGDLDSSNTLTPHVLESRIRRQFPVRLKSLLKSQVASAETARESERAALADRLIVTVKEVSYGSIDLTVAIEPLDALITLFDGKFEYFEAFLHTYVPLAFRDALRPDFGTYYGGWADVVFEADLSIRPSAALIQEFEALRQIATRSTPPPTHSAKQQYAQWLWVASNTSLVVPTILAAFFLYLGWQTVDKRFAAIDGASIERMKALLPEKASSSPSTAGSAASSSSPAASRPKP
jgi:hypothetical protein